LINDNNILKKHLDNVNSLIEMYISNFQTKFSHPIRQIEENPKAREKIKLENQKII
jgi:hypothetical protein